MKINSERISKADESRGALTYKKEYLYPAGYECKEIRTTQHESDYVNKTGYRISADNGKSYTEWIPLEQREYSQIFGEDELISLETPRIWNPIHCHYVST